MLFDDEESGFGAIQEILLVAVDLSADQGVGVRRQHGVIGIAVRDMPGLRVSKAITFSKKRLLSAYSGHRRRR